MNRCHGIGSPRQPRLASGRGIFVLLSCVAVVCGGAQRFGGLETGVSPPFIASSVQRDGLFEQLRLLPKDPRTWKIRSNGSMGILVFDRENGRFYFTGIGLKPKLAYALVRYCGKGAVGQLLAVG